MKAAKSRGVRVGRPPKLTEFQRREAASMLDDGKARSDIAALLNVHVGTLRRSLKGLTISGQSQTPNKGDAFRLCTGRKGCKAA